MEWMVPIGQDDSTQIIGDDVAERVVTTIA